MILLRPFNPVKNGICFCVETFPKGVVLIHDDWGTNFKVRTSVNLTPEQWRSSKDVAYHNFLLRYIDGEHEGGGVSFNEHALHFLCDVPNTETVSSCLNFHTVLEYVMKTVPYEVKLIIRWTDGTSKQYKNVGNVGFEKMLSIKFKIRISHNFFPTNWGKGVIDLLGGIVPGLYAKLITILKERANDLRLVTREMNSRYSVPGSTRAESSLSFRVFFHVSREQNEVEKKERTKWKTLNFQSGVTKYFFFKENVHKSNILLFLNNKLLGL